MICFVNIKDDSALLPYFLDHYRKLGILRFHIGVHLGEKNPIWPLLKSISDVHAFSVGDKDRPFTGEMDSKAQDQNRADRVDQVGVGTDYYVVADLDEFAVPYNGFKFQQIADRARRARVDVVAGELFDRVTPDGSIPTHLETDIWKQFPVTLQLTTHLAKGNPTKAVMARMDVPIESGHHCHCRNSSWMIPVYHFKWRGDLVARMQDRVRTLKSADLPWQLEPERVLDHLTKNNGRINIEEMTRLDVEHRQKVVRAV